MFGTPNLTVGATGGQMYKSCLRQIAQPISGSRSMYKPVSKKQKESTLIGVQQQKSAEIGSKETHSQYWTWFSTLTTLTFALMASKVLPPVPHSI